VKRLKSRCERAIERLNDHSVLKRDKSKKEEEAGWEESFEGGPRSTLVEGTEEKRGCAAQRKRVPAAEFLGRCLCIHK